MRKIALFVAALFLVAPFAFADDTVGVAGGPPNVARAAVGTFVTLGYVDDSIQHLDGSVTLGIGLEGGRVTVHCSPAVAAQCEEAFGKVSTFTGTVYTDGREVENVFVASVGG